MKRDISIQKIKVEQSLLNLLFLKYAFVMGQLQTSLF